MALIDLLTIAVTNSYGLIYKWGYFGVFLGSLISGASLFFFPLPAQALVVTAGGILNPFLVAIAATLGSTIGDTITYILGLGGKEILERKYERKLERVEKRFEKHGAFMWIFIAALLPFPFDVVSIFCGVIKYDFKRFLAAMFLGKLIKHIILAYTGVGLITLFEF